MIPVTDGYDRPNPCPKCDYMHMVTDHEREGRQKWVTKQHATDRYTWKKLIADEWTNGDIVCDCDGDLWMFWDDHWIDPASYQREIGGTECRMEVWVEGEITAGAVDETLPNYEPFAVFYRMPRLNRPVFANLAEAEAWLDANGR